MQRILYVEDEDLNWEVTEFTLSDKFSLVRARNAHEAFELLSREQFLVVLMDIQLKGSDMDGIAITRAIKGKDDGSGHGYTSLHPEVPVIFVTAFGTRYRRDELFSAGGGAIISKPVDFTALTLAISRLVGEQSKKSASEVRRVS